MCGRFEQSETPRYYANALSAHISERLKTLSDNTTVFALPGPAATPPRLEQGVIDNFVGSLTFSGEIHEHYL